VQSSAKVTGSGEAISSATYQAENWMQADVPTTVVAAQVKSGVLPDPFYGKNLRGYPGVGYPIGANFSNIAMPPDSPYAVSWWYRKEFSLSDGFLGKTDLAGKTVWLNFRGINYRANIFLNGKRIADSDQVAGAWRTYEFNVSSAVKPGTNVLAVQVWAPTRTWGCGVRCI
jgi:exo-1,4-beta-D-glucosaminidase